MDSCQEHVGGGGGQPHFHGDPFGDQDSGSSSPNKCLYGPSNYTSGVTGHPPLIGFAFDGHLIYGRYLSAAAPGFSAPLLDACGGHSHSSSSDVDENGISLGSYHYHTQVFDRTCPSGNMCVAGEVYKVSTTGPFNCFKANLAASITEGSSALLVASVSDSHAGENDMKYRCCEMEDYYMLTGNTFPSTSDYDGTTTCVAPANPDHGSFADTCATGQTLLSGNTCTPTCEEGYESCGTTRCVKGVITELATCISTGASCVKNFVSIAQTDQGAASPASEPAATLAPAASACDPHTCCADEDADGGRCPPNTENGPCPPGCDVAAATTSDVDCVETGNTAADCLDSCAVAAATVTTAQSGSGTACLGDYTCVAGDGACPAASSDPCAAVTCPAVSDACHVQGTCSGGTCSAETNAADGSSCDDGNAVTTPDTCASGVCGGTDPCAAVTCSAASDNCHVQGICSGGTCSAETNKADGSSCDDSNVATVDDVCASGVCTGSHPQLCSASAFATDSQCAAVSGSSLSLFNTARTCTGVSCLHAECCVAPQLCSASSFPSESGCAAGSDSSLSVFTTSGTCAGLACMQSECCEAAPVHCDGNWTEWYHSDNHTDHSEIVVDMESGEFSDWLTCSVSCGGGVQWKHWVVVVAAANGGSSCAAAHGHSEQQSCNEQACPADAVCQWSDWGACSLACGGGTRDRTYTLMEAAAGGGVDCVTAPDTTESEACNSQECSVAADCAGEYGQWRPCSAVCGNGTSSRHYHIVTEAANGGSSSTCTAADMTEETQACNSGECPVDCSGRWGQFGACSLTCGGGFRERTYTVDVSAAHGGSALTCDNPNGGTDSEPCNVDPCPEPEPEPEPEPVAIVVAETATVVVVTTTLYTTEQLEAAKDEVLVAVATAPENSAAVTIVSAITFPVAIEVIGEGSAARISFEADFKTQIASKLGGGGVFAAEAIIIDSIVAGSVEVQFHVAVPANVQIQAASMLTTLAASGGTVSITVGSTVVHVSTAAMTPPLVIAAPAPEPQPEPAQPSVGGTVELTAPKSAASASTAAARGSVVGAAVALLLAVI